MLQAFAEGQVNTKNEPPFGRYCTSSSNENVEVNKVVLPVFRKYGCFGRNLFQNRQILILTPKELYKKKAETTQIYSKQMRKRRYNVMT